MKGGNAVNCIFAVADCEGLRADKYLVSAFPELSRNFIQDCFKSGGVTVNGKPAAKSLKLYPGDEVSFTWLDARVPDAKPENIPLDIVYEDDDLLVVNKPKGMVVHPAPGNYEGTLVNALLYHCGDRLSGINGVLRPGIVHRIDKMTSGLLMVAKTDAAHRGLAEQIAGHSFDRAYEAICLGAPKEDNFTLDFPIGRDPKDRKKMAVTDKNSKEARTDVTVTARYPGAARVVCRLYTGRTHQIRVHLAHIGHPLLGDDVYGGKAALFEGLEGQCLHAARLGFTHPVTGEKMEFTSELPDYFKNVLTKLEKRL